MKKLILSSMNTCKHIVLCLGLSVTYAPMTHTLWPFGKSSTQEQPKNQPETKDQVIEFVRQVLKKSSVENPESIKVGSSDRYTASREEILVPYDQLNTIICEKNNLDSTASIDTIKKRYEEQVRQNYLQAEGSIYHEAGHLSCKHRDRKEQFNKNILKVARTIDGCVVTSVLATAMREVCRTTPLSPMKILLLLSAGPFILAKEKIGDLAERALSRKCEWEADECVPNEPDLLHAKAKEFEKKHNNALMRLALNKYATQQSKQVDKKNTHAISNWFSTHPTHLARANRFRERAVALENRLGNGYHAPNRS
ncbi:M48 family metalloprotease [Candidatus Dependentiae bacterium]|nr:M48 family metalloprotease [Candidatus Dependentiae bacterium]MCC7415206.1 M48 family metalloprotease [Campylobacterota bacterium]